MKIELIAINAKYIHSCPAVYSLQAFALEQGARDVEIGVEEYTINDSYHDVLSAIMSEKADVMAFSVYIWNVGRVRALIRDIRKVCGHSVQIWAGGPEPTYSPDSFLTDGADLCMLGEGEETFLKLADGLPGIQLSDIRGLAYLNDSKFVSTGQALPVDLNRIPFLYKDLSLFRNKILYYESSRGCPFGCAYCLSGKERGIRFRHLEKVFTELQFFLDHFVPQVKFVDRTFNVNDDRACLIWEYLKEHDNGVTNFHFEIEAGRMSPRQIKLLSSLRPGLVQLEIGVQSSNAAALKSVNRASDISPITFVMKELTKKQNINLHLDLIAGLPYEDMSSFRKSFQAVYDMRPHQLQLGFLKLLKGTELDDKKDEYNIVSSDEAPYEVLKTRWLSFDDLVLLHRISDRVEEYVNSQGFRRSLPLAETLFDDAFMMFERLALYYRENGFEKNRSSVFQRYDIFLDFVREESVRAKKNDSGWLRKIEETVRLDRFLHTHPSRRMTAREWFHFPEGDVLIRFDYQVTSLVNKETHFKVIEGYLPEYVQ